MKINESQKAMITAWIEEGADLSAIQSRIQEEWNQSLTYMETRFLIDDLELSIKDKPQPVAEKDITKQPAVPADGTPSSVSVSVDALTRPGAAISGTATFSDGKEVPWQLDAYGRLGLIPQEEGYRPPQEDMQDFQMEIQKVLAQKGF